MKKLAMIVSALVISGNVYAAIGDDNTSIVQLSQESDMNVVEISQISPTAADVNSSKVYMNGSSDENKVKVFQSGDNNTNLIKLSGDADKNKINSSQLGSGNNSTITVQGGDKNVIKGWTQGNDNIITVDVNGDLADNNKVDIVQLSSFSKADVDITATTEPTDFNHVYITQTANDYAQVSVTNGEQNTVTVWQD